jgi:hypothetical protein
MRLTTGATPVLIAALMLPACSSSSAPVVTFSQPADVAGQYAGTVQDSVAGTQAVGTSTLSQHLSSVGGALVMPIGSESVSWTVGASNAVSGSGALEVAGATCLFVMTGSYNPSTFQITGSYSAASGCSGRTGTYTLTQTCSEPVESKDRRPQTVPPRC